MGCLIVIVLRLNLVQFLFKGVIQWGMDMNNLIKIAVGSAPHIVGYTADGEPYVSKMFYVQATDSSGYCLRHVKEFPAAHRVVDKVSGTVYYEDDSKYAKMEAERLAYRVKCFLDQGGSLVEDLWYDADTCDTM